MTIKPNKSAGILTQELSNHLRCRLKVLPQDYEQFLLLHNGGTPVPEVMFPIPNSDNDGFRLSEFFPIHCTAGVEGIDLQIEEWQMDFGEGFVPIGADGIGNYFLLSLHPQSVGCVFFHDHELVDEDDRFSGLVLLADSFSAFQSALVNTDYTEPDWEAKREADLQQILSTPKRPWWRFW